MPGGKYFIKLQYKCGMYSLFDKNKKQIRENNNLKQNQQHTASSFLALTKIY